jgi:hypothetical protein
MLEVGDFVGIRPLVGARGYESARGAHVTWQFPPPTSDEDEVNDVPQVFSFITGKFLNSPISLPLSKCLLLYTVVIENANQANVTSR